MGSTYNIIPSAYFLNQIKELKDKSLIESKLRLIKHRPFRFKVLESYRFVFAVKIRLNGYKRLIYLVEPKDKEVFVFGLFDRKKGFKDFQKFYESYIKNK